MGSSSRRPSLSLLLFVLAGAACADDEGAAAPADASSDVTRDAASADAPGADAATPDAVVPSDAATPDAVVSPDVTTTPDAVVSPDVTTTPDAALVDRAVVDAARPDATTTPDAGCAGSAPVVTVTAPAPDAMIETCTESGMRVYYDFRATVTTSGAVRQVTAQWRTPDGAIAPPPPPPLTAAPYVWRRQVGGMMVDVPPLAILGGALRGTWHFDVTATDACGRSTTVAQPFSLIFTTRRCPNP